MSLYDAEGKKIMVGSACSTFGCEATIHAQGRCSRCYIRARRAGTVVVEQRAERLKSEWELDTSGARCRCGLRLPCNDCTATNAVDHMSRMDRGSASGL